MASSRSPAASPILSDAADDEYNRESSHSQSAPPNLDDAGDDENNGGSSRSTSEHPSPHHAADDYIELEDECPICFELLFDPLTTRCQHTFCRICLEDMITAREVSPEYEGPPAGPETLYWFDSSAGQTRGVRCPICQQQTYVTEDTARAQALQQKYPGIWASRGGRPSWGGDNGDGIQTISLWMASSYVGSLDLGRGPIPYGAPGFYKWTFILEPSRTDIIAETWLGQRSPMQV
ncbi:hypothetical protein DL769_007698 [Monosporascus sp. CRB-8-3]|nr:hypothetical protein DL769_007698 [Monosporascus sp. CRB-8-3]